MQDQINYTRIANAIDYILRNFKEQPSLDEVAGAVNMSPFHFHKLFMEWAGTTPKKFLQYVSAQYAKKLLKENNASLFETAYQTGLSGTGRLHDLFINIEGMTPAEYRNGGQELFINYSFSESPFGHVIIASTSKGICHLSFERDELEGLANIRSKFPNAQLVNHPDNLQQNALSIFRNDWNALPQIKLHLKGTPFQLKVWEALLHVPMGRVTTYGTIAQKINLQTASRAVGTEIGSNPVAFLIPCHRVIKSSGALGGYMWGANRKAAIIGWEGVQIDGLQA